MSRLRAAFSWALSSGSAPARSTHTTGALIAHAPESAPPESSNPILRPTSGNLGRSPSESAKSRSAVVAGCSDAGASLDNNPRFREHAHPPGAFHRLDPAVNATGHAQWPLFKPAGLMDTAGDSLDVTYSSHVDGYFAKTLELRQNRSRIRMAHSPQWRLKHPVIRKPTRSYHGR